jgi:hypothetical protein
MNKIIKILSVLFILSLTIILISPVQAATTETSITEKVQSSSNLSQEKLQAKVEQQKSKVEEKVEDTLVSEAQEAVQETQKAIASIEKGNKQDALKALESATGKLDLVLARQPELGFVPLESKVEIISLAPSDLDTVKKIRKEAKQAIRKDELVKARALLDNLASELRITTVNLPLATYPTAMEEAAQLLDRDEFDPAKKILQTALSTLFIEEKQSPLPVIKAQALIDEADSLIQIDGHEEIVQSLLAEARKELKFAQELGYENRDQQYALLDDAIKDIKKQITAGDRAEIAFSNLKDKLGGFFERISS